MTTSSASKERKGLLAAVPWVTWVDAKHPCDGIKWSRVSIKAAFGTKAELERFRCKNVAHWKFAALKERKADHGFPGTSGMYCRSHLRNQMLYPERERERYEKWWTDIGSDLLYENTKGSDA